MTSRCASLACAVLTALTLAGCATAPPRPPVADPEAAWTDRITDMSHIESWKAKGKLAVNTQKRGGSANMVWQRSGINHHINLYGPFGGGRVILTRDAAGAKLRDNKKRIYRAPTAEEVLHNAAGWRVPFAAMQYWILGVPAPNGKFIKTLDQYGRLASLQQDGWEIQFLEYRFFEQRELPRKLRLKALSGTEHITDDKLRENDQVELKVVIKRWSI